MIVVQTQSTQIVINLTVRIRVVCTSNQPRSSIQIAKRVPLGHSQSVQKRPVESEIIQF